MGAGGGQNLEHAHSRLNLVKLNICMYTLPQSIFILLTGTNLVVNKHIFTSTVENNVDPDQLTSSEAS